MNSRAQESAGEVDADHLVPFFQGHVHECRILLDAGVAADDVERAEFPDRVGEHAAHVVFLADVGLDRDGMTAASGVDIVANLLRDLRLHDVVDHDVGAAGGEFARHAFADAGVGARDERALALEVWIGACGHGGLLGVDCESECGRLLVRNSAKAEPSPQPLSRWERGFKAVTCMQAPSRAGSRTGALLQRRREHAGPYDFSSSQPPSKPARCRPVRIAGHSRIRFQIRPVRWFSIISTIGPWFSA